MRGLLPDDEAGTTPALNELTFGVTVWTAQDIERMPQKVRDICRDHLIRATEADSAAFLREHPECLELFKSDRMCH